MTTTWLITGCASGIGRNTAALALERGANVVATARSAERLLDLKKDHGNRIALVDLDVTDEHAARAAVDIALEKFGRLDVLVNSAGYSHLGPFEQKSTAAFRAEVETNFFGVVNLVRAALPHMRLQRSGYIINISSSSARFGGPGSSAYVAAKWAVSGFTESLAKEIAPFGVRAIAIEPGSIRTDWTRVARAHLPKLLPEYEATVGSIMKRTEGLSGNEPGDPDKVAKVILDLTQRDDLPEHLILGSDALLRVAQAEASRSQSAAAWEAVSRSTDFQ
jgi:NAD(P)-dependent dehydrogenase (short-subunit alcohol dehydrogenase family)